MPKFRGENFHGWLSTRKIHERFLHQKFPAIQYHYPQCRCHIGIKKLLSLVEAAKQVFV